MKLINDKIVTITIKETEFAEFRIRMPQHPDKTVQTIYRDVDWYRLPHQPHGLLAVASMDVHGSFILTEHCSDEIVRYIVSNKDFPEFDIIMNPASRSNALAHSMATKLYQLKWKEISGYTVVARTDENRNYGLEVSYRPDNTMKDKTLHIVNVDADLIKDRRVLLVDDVYVSGATLDACTKLVDKAGGKVVGAVTIGIREGCKPLDGLHYLFELPILKK